MYWGAFHNPSLHTTNKHTAYLCKWRQNGTRCRDGVKVLWCHYNLVWLVFEASIPTCACFPSENFLSLVLSIKQTERQTGRQRDRQADRQTGRQRDRRTHTMLETVVSSVEVGIYDSMPPFGADVREWANKLSSAVVHQVVKTTVVLHCVLHECLHLKCRGERSPQRVYQQK